MHEIPHNYRIYFIYSALAIITLAAFWQVHNFEFTNYDDNIYVSDNYHILSGFTRDGIVWVFTHEHMGSWHPLTGLSYMLDCQLFGPNPGRHHLISLLLHIANTLLLFAVFKRATGALWQSAFVAALFAIHPLHVETVAWISDRNDVLSTLFWILTIGTYFRYAEKRSLRWYATALLLFTLGLMAKPMLVTLPFLLLLLDYWPLNRFESAQFGKTCGSLILEKIPFFVISAASSIVTFFVFKTSGQVATIEVAPVTSRVCNAVVAYMKYIEKTIWPSGLTIFYPYSENTFQGWQLLTAVILLVIITICVICFARKRRYLLVGWFWYLGTLVPVIGLVQIRSYAIADRYTYIPLVGLFIIVAWGTTNLLQNWRYGRIVHGTLAAAVISVLFLCTWLQTSHWRNSKTLFEHALKVTTGNYLACNNLSVVFIEQNKFDEAIDLLGRTLQFKPNYAEAYCNLGVIYGKLGRYEEEIKACKQAIRIRPNYAEAYSNLGMAYGQVGRYQEEIETCKQTIRINPDLAEAYNNLGFAYGRVGRYEEEIEACKKAVRLKPDFAEAYNNLGAVYAQLGRREEAIEAFKQAVRINPKLSSAYYNLGLIYASGGDKNAAMERYKILKTLDANSAERLRHFINKQGSPAK